MRNNLIEQLAEYVQAQPDYTQAKPAFVSVYRRHQCYGGPEEGGWWYDRDVLEGSKRFSSREEADAWLESAKAEVLKLNKEEAPARFRAMANLPDPEREPLPDYPDGEGYIPRGWDDGGELWITVEETMGASDNSNEPRPHYE